MNIRTLTYYLAICAVTTVSNLYAPLAPVDFLAAIRNAAGTTDEAKEKLAVVWMEANPTLLTDKLVLAGFKAIFKAVDGAAGLKAAQERAKAMKGGTGGAEMGLAPAVKTAIDAVSKAADKKAAATAALKTIGKETGKPLAAASGLSADEITTALKAGMAS